MREHQPNALTKKPTHNNIIDNTNNANSELAAFSFGIGHDFGNTLNHLLSYLKLLEERIKNNMDEKSLHYLEVINGRGKHLEQMIHAIKDYNYIAQSNINFSLVDPNNIIKEIINNEEFQTKNTIQWECDILPSVYADPMLLKEIFKILIDNAIKFSISKKDPTIKITLFNIKQEKNKVKIAIQDNGVGFDAENANRLFWPFQRFHSENEFTGLGMGLATALRIVHMLQGNLEILSNSNKGTTCVLTLLTSKQE